MIESLVPVGTTVMTFEFCVGTVRMFSPTVAYFVPVTVSAGVGSLTPLTLPVVALAFLVALAAGAGGSRSGLGWPAPRAASARAALEAAGTLATGAG